MESSESIMKRLEIEHLDLRRVTRECHYHTAICLKNPYGGEEEWIITGQLEVLDNNVIPGAVDIGSRYRKGVTDQEHDSAWVFKIPLIGYRYVHTYWGLIEFNGHIAPPQGGFGLNDLRLPTAPPDTLIGDVVCTDCKEEHPIVDYLPKACSDLYRSLAGRMVTIKMGVDPEHYAEARGETQ